MKLLVALLLATSVEGLDTKKQVALKKPLLLRGGAFGPKKALLAQTAGLTIFGTEFILAKWASTRYFVRARRYMRKSHSARYAPESPMPRPGMNALLPNSQAPNTALALSIDLCTTECAYCRTMRVRRRLSSSSPRSLVSDSSPSRPWRITRPRPATLRRWRLSARFSPTFGFPRRWFASTHTKVTMNDQPPP